MNPLDIIGRIGDLYKLFNVIQEKLNRQDDEIKLLRSEAASLRKENSGLAERVAVLEESRKAIDFQVETKMTAVITQWQVENLKERLRQERLIPKQISPSDSNERQ